MALSCIYGGECIGCVACADCTRYAEPEDDDAYNRRIDAAYDKEELHG